MLCYLYGFFSTLLFISSVYAQANICAQHQCVAVVDAGSSGSRLHIYSYDLDATHSPININQEGFGEVTTGLSSIPSETETVNKFLTDLTSTAFNKIGIVNKPIPIYFYATAGMRLYPYAKQMKYYDEIRQWFAKKPQWNLIQVKTISGSDEALYGWLAVNYFKGALQTPSKSSIGIIDIGGASVQIAFPLKNSFDTAANSQVNLKVYGRQHKLFVKSFLGLGQSLTSNHFLTTSACFPLNYPLPDGGMGQGQAETCEKGVSALVNKVHGVDKEIQTVLSQNPVDTWYGIGGMSYFIDSSVFHFTQGQMTGNNLIEQANSRVCSQDWNTLNAQFPKDKFTYLYCFIPAYYHALMVTGFGIAPERTINGLSSKQGAADWTEGVIVYKHAV